MTDPNTGASRSPGQQDVGIRWVRHYNNSEHSGIQMDTLGLRIPAAGTFGAALSRTRTAFAKCVPSRGPYKPRAAL
jgi:hypothetical protein